jgi:hypothetical protein
MQALQEACDTLYRQCDLVLSKIEERLPEITEDRVQLEEKIRAMQADDDDDVEEGDDQDEGMELQEQDGDSDGMEDD